MKNKGIKSLLAVLFASFLYACGDSAEDISFGFDHEVPQYEVLTDSLIVDLLQTVEIKVNISDNERLKKLVFAYGDWGISQSLDLEQEGFIKEYLFEATITIPEDAEKEWQESVTEKDGAIRTITQTYHKLTITATDINMNVATIPIYIKVR